MPNSCYVHKQDYSKDYFIFITDDDVWKVETSLENYKDGQVLDAVRVTSNRAKVLEAKISPDGAMIAFVSDESGERDCYVISRFGGEVKRISYLGDVKLIGWKNDSTIRLASSNNRYRCPTLREINYESLETDELNFGPLDYYAKSSEGADVVGRFISNLSFWKGYKGGRSGQIWLKKRKEKSFTRILDKLKANIGALATFENYIYFLTDKDGCGNVYAYDLDTGRTKKITDNDVFYVRSFSVGDLGILFSSAGDLFFRSHTTKETKKINLRVISSFEESRERFVKPSHFLEAYECDYDASLVLSVVRGKLFYMKPWTGSAKEIELDQVSRFRNVTASQNTGHYFAVVVLEGGEERIVSIQLNLVTGDIKSQFVATKNIGKIKNILISKGNKWVVITTLRNEIWVVKAAKNNKFERLKLVDKGNYLSGCDISRDEKWLVYSLSSARGSTIWIYNLETNKKRRLLEPVFEDISPKFDLTKDYLYFVGKREFATQMNSEFELSFPDITRPYVLALNKNVDSLFELPLNHEAMGDDEKSEMYSEEKSNIERGEAENAVKLTKKSKPKTSGAKMTSSSKNKKEKPSRVDKEKELVIDFDDLETRIQPFPVKVGGWEEILVTEDRLFFERSHQSNAKIQADEPSIENSLISYNLSEGSFEHIVEDYQGGVLSPDGKWLMIYQDSDFRLFPSDSKPSEGNEYSRKDGWVEVARIKASINPKTEWLQMYEEAWQLQKENFFNPHVKDVNFGKIFKKYLPLVSKVNTRYELSDLIWEMQGDLKTSHAYEYNGDFAFKSRNDKVGRLGASLRFDSSKKCYVIEKIFRGESWQTRGHSPMHSLGAQLAVGDEIYKLDGRSFDSSSSLDQQLLNKVEEYVDLEVKRTGKKKKEIVSVVSAAKESNLAYRDWVEMNRAHVYRKSRGKVGYIHIPNMVFEGYAEFFKGYLREASKKALIIDVRHNGGGFVSQFILKVLGQKRIGFSQSKWQSREPYPLFCNAEKMVCLINEDAGSDGDIFSHAFKKLKLGPLVGTRTWGGVIGIWPKSKLVDGTVVTQPEYNFEFDDVGGILENKGVNPDIKVEITPDDWKKSKDPQLEKALELLV